MRLVVVVLALVIASQAAAQQPRFRTGIDVIPIDVTVVTRDGRPVQDLRAEDFSVHIDGRQRRIVSLVAPSPAPSNAPRTAAPPAPSDAPRTVAPSTPFVPSVPRPVVLVLDQPNIGFGRLRDQRDALNDFVDGLPSSSPIMVLGLGSGARSTGFTTNRADVRRAINGAVGGAPYPPSNKTTGELTVDVIKRLLTELRTIDAAKTVVLASEGLAFDAERPSFQEIRNLAAAARTTVHVLRLNQRRIDSGRAGVAPDTAPEPSTRGILTRPEPTETIQGVEIPAFQRDPTLADAMEGLDGITGLAFATGGSVFNVPIAADQALGLINATLTSYYLIGVESQPIDVDGLAKPIEVTVNRPGLIVRARRQFQAN